jgi:asparagine synthase (glutamine-hydrolysing)
MCGIAGWAGPVDADEGALARMCAAIAHRGPDDEGFLVQPGKVGLGFRRLSIIDLNTGAQPMLSEDGSVAACCNGEIYNFRSLRTELVADGHTFSSQSDSEVILHLYEKLGADFVTRLEGMFAISLWDRDRERLVLARDRLGVKPLYWARVPGGLVYGSEPAAILAAGLVDARPDPSAIVEYLTLQYVPPPGSGFQGIAKLAPGEMLLFENGSVSVNRYWSLHHPEPRSGHHVEESIDQLDALLENATRQRLVSDVPVGAFLSGGVDSSLVVSYMAAASSQVSTFSIDFPHAGFNEGEYARRVASIYGTEHHDLTVEPDIVPTILETTRFTGEPFADSSAIPTYLLSQMTRRTVTVALSGDGGDEAFAGYTRHKVATYADWLGKAPGVAKSVAALIPGGDQHGRLGRLRRGLETVVLPAHDRYATMMAHFPPADIEALVTPEYLNAAGGSRQAWNETLAIPRLPGVNKYAALDATTYLPGDLLLKVDRMSMAHALEVRSPLLDRRVHEFAAALPPRDKLRRGRTKWILKELAARRGLPKDLVHRRKHGFGIPIGDWFRGELRPWLTEVLLDPRTRERGYFRQDQVAELLQNHIEGRADHGYRLYNLAALELWHRAHVDGAQSKLAEAMTAASAASKASSRSQGTT